jgi:hypothetical protein
MRHRLSRAGCGVPRVALHATPGRHRQPALRHYERTPQARFTRVFDALWSSQTVTRRFASPRAGPAATNRRGGAPKGERPDRKGRETPRKRLRAYVTGPRRVPRKHPSAYRRSAPLALSRRETQQSSEESCLARRMKHARKLSPPSFRGATQSRARNPYAAAMVMDSGLAGY